MRPDKERPAENTCRIVKGLDAVWAHFCPSKPCLPLLIDGIVTEKNSPVTENTMSLSHRGDLVYFFLLFLFFSASGPLPLMARYWFSLSTRAWRFLAFSFSLAFLMAAS